MTTGPDGGEAPRSPTPSRGTRARLGLAAAVGLGAGLLSGLFGVGGGILIVPGLVVLLRIPQRLAHGTSLAAIVPIAVSGVVGYAAADSIDWSAAGLVTLGSVWGALLGTRVLHVVRQDSLRIAFAAFLLLTAARMIVVVPDAMGRGAITPTMSIGLIALGLVSGTLAGLLGVGGGIVVIPALVLLFDVPDAIAKGTSLLVIVPTAVAATVANLRRSNANLPVAATVGAFGVASAFAASQLSVKLDPKISGVLFGLLLVAVAGRMLLGRRTRPEG